MIVFRKLLKFHELYAIYILSMLSKTVYSNNRVLSHQKSCYSVNDHPPLAVSFLKKGGKSYKFLNHSFFSEQEKLLWDNMPSKSFWFHPFSVIEEYLSNEEGISCSFRNTPPAAVPPSFPLKRPPLRWGWCDEGISVGPGDRS